MSEKRKLAWQDENRRQRQSDSWTEDQRQCSLDTLKDDMRLRGRETLRSLPRDVSIAFKVAVDVSRGKGGEL